MRPTRSKRHDFLQLLRDMAAIPFLAVALLGHAAEWVVDRLLDTEPGNRL